MSTTTPDQAAKQSGRRDTFRDRLAVGSAGQNIVVQWLQRQGFVVARLCDLPAEDGRGPRLLTPFGDVVAPDLLVVRGGRGRWAEVKLKTGATLHRISSAWLTGVDVASFEAYNATADASGMPLWTLFLHCRCPGPTGLHGAPLSRLRSREHHRSGGLVFWRVADLMPLATLADLGLADERP